MRLFLLLGVEGVLDVFVVIEVVCGIIQNERGEILMCRRPAGKHLGGLWEFPGGKVEEGEHFSETLIRELKEELDVTVEVGGALQPVEWKDESVNLRLRPFFCKISRGTPVALEHQELKWCGVSEVFLLELAPADVPILQEIRYLDARM